MENLQTILGAGGAVGIELAKELPRFTGSIRLVSRNPVKINDADQVMQADLTRPDDVDKAVEGSSVVYITVGFPYSSKVWARTWPPFMRSVIDSCSRHGARLVFFDNIYMYDKDRLDGMTEDTPFNPSSRKGAVRAGVARMVMDAVEQGRVSAQIARCADFYGPGRLGNSILNEMAFKPLSTGKKANWQADDSVPHSFTFTPDAGKATALLGNTPDAYDQVWHLPTTAAPFTGKEWVGEIARVFGTPPSYRVVSAGMLGFLGIFVPVLREIKEMMYQYDRPYIFDSSKFERRFEFAPTPYREGIETVIREDYS